MSSILGFSRSVATSTKSGWFLNLHKQAVTPGLASSNHITPIISGGKNTAVSIEIEELMAGKKSAQQNKVNLILKPFDFNSKLQYIDVSV